MIVKHLDQKLLSTICDYSLTVKEICNPLFSSLGFNYFNVQLLYRNGARVHLNANPKWLQHYYEQKHYNLSRSDKNPDEYVNGYGLWDAWNQTDMGALVVAKDARENFDYAHGIMITKCYPEYTAIYGFATNRSNYNINNFYCGNLDILENFIFSFNQKATKIIKSAKNNAFIIEKNPTLLPEDTYAKKIEIPKNLLYQPLTQRELICISWLVKGKTTKETGLILGISSRTVEKHITHIKEKLGCYTLYQLGRIVNKMGLEHFLDTI